MPITEFATLRIKEPYTLQDEDLHGHFRTLSKWQAEWSSFPLTFYTNVDDHSLIYLISGWESVEAHMKWIASERNQELLRIFDSFISIAAFAHIDIDFTEIPEGTQVLALRKGEPGDIGAEEGLGPHMWTDGGRDLEESSHDMYRIWAYGEIEFQANAALKSAGGVQLLRRINPV
ncbi:hypothetical protein NLJ89_g2504 [Agrocybe chaxingu]|uniref:ABM domain-containing protein n=1 Tax=Agrocybe chaxingu TaxID=84603 RepID=A0A9W8K6G1_9AGAR|nr:hypothetical protein NLJ89_g2504 [Agrocybe chaxingu]